MIDDEGFRANVGIILSHSDGRVFWGKRVTQASWQFPQGGIDEGETPVQAMYRELYEETGLLKKHVEVMGKTQDWLRYRLPNKMIRRYAHDEKDNIKDKNNTKDKNNNNNKICIGQKQRWFLLRLICDDSSVNLEACDVPEFDDWRWVNYWLPAKEVVYFKRRVYERALQELAPLTLIEHE